MKNTVHKPSYTTLHEAVLAEDVTAVSQLIEAGNSVNDIDSYKQTPLHNAVIQGNLEIATLLLAFEGIDVNITDISGSTPLHNAVIQGNLEIATLLLAFKGIDVNITDINGFTPLHKAVIRGNLEIATLLLAFKGIDVNITDINGFTPLHKAVIRGNLEIATLLLAFEGIDVNILDKAGNTALSLAQQRCKNTQIVKLLQANANQNSQQEEEKDTTSERKILKISYVIAAIGGAILFAFLLRKLLVPQVVQEFISEKTKTIGSFIPINTLKVSAENTLGKFR